MKAIFSPNEDFNKSAFLNWRTKGSTEIRNMLILAEGYLDASILMAKACLANNDDKKADIIIFPILTTANHGIELYLKSINWVYNKLLGSEKKIEGAHNIRQIFQTVKAKVKLYRGNLSMKEFNRSMIELEEYIKELFERIDATPKDDKMDFSRYPINNEYDNHFYVREIDNVTIDLENFIERFEVIKERLGTMADYLFYQELNGEW